MFLFFIHNNTNFGNTLHLNEKLQMGNLFTHIILNVVRLRYYMTLYTSLDIFT